MKVHRIITACVALAGFAAAVSMVRIVSAQQTFNVYATADNQYELYTGTATTALVDRGGAYNTTAGQILGTLANGGVEHYTLITTPNDNFVYVAAWSDKAVDQGFLGSFENVTPGNSGFVYSGDPQWQVFATGINKNNGDPVPTYSDLNAQLAIAAAGGGASHGWVTPAVYSIDNGGGGPYHTTVPDVGGAAKWMWWNGPVPYADPDNAFTDGGNHGEYLIFRIPVTSVPEPSSIVLTLFAAAGFAATALRLGMKSSAVTEGTAKSRIVTKGLSMNRLLIPLLLFFAVSVIVASQASQARAVTLQDGLYGWTRIPDANGNVDVVSIDSSTGQATKLFSVPVPQGYLARDLTFDPIDGYFYGSLWNGGPGLLAAIDPTQETIHTYAYTGDVLDSPTEGIEYSKNENGIIISGGDYLYRVTVNGVVSAKTLTYPPVYDQDSIGANMFGGELHVFDTNNGPNNGGVIVKWNDPPGPFGVHPTVTAVYNGPVFNTESDLAIDPYTNTFYTSNQTSLLRFNMSSQQEELVGNYNYSSIISGITAVPEPPSIIVAAFGLAMLLAARCLSLRPGALRVIL